MPAAPLRRHPRPDQMPVHERPTTSGLQVLLKSEGLVLVLEAEHGDAFQRTLVPCIVDETLVVPILPPVRVFCTPHVVASVRALQHIHMVGRPHDAEVVVDRFHRGRAELDGTFSGTWGRCGGSKEPAFAEPRAMPVVPLRRGKGGAGGDRTLVQTTEERAFYMLSRSLVFDRDLGIGTLVPA